ncbi:MAG: hydroxyethylthiazole kinase-like uncharacterized protein yjeF [Planctomycetota bacterium]|jgi:hydroxyethylthiazole kinase-like uncharacterized protein yjeF
MSDNPPKLPHRRRLDHKGNCGRVLILAGSRPFFGAAALAMAGAARGGAGYVLGGVPASIVSKITPFLPSTIVLGQRETSTGHLSYTALADIEELMASCDVLVVGPGLGKNEGLEALLSEILERARIPVVLDADALNLVAEAPQLIPDTSDLIFTPHPGEAARLLKMSVANIESDRHAALSKLIELQPGVFVLKGAGTLVGCKGDVYRNSTGNPAMAVAGMGDVLSGLIGALVAQGSAPYDAACQAVWAHGRAGDLAALEVGHRGVLPMDLVDRIPRALSELQV